MQIIAKQKDFLIDADQKYETDLICIFGSAELVRRRQNSAVGENFSFLGRQFYLDSDEVML